MCKDFLFQKRHAFHFSRPQSMLNDVLPGYLIWIHVMTRVISCLAAALSVALAPAAGAQGSPWKHPDGTTHWYEAVAAPGGVAWDAANSAANAAGGYLVTITSAAENDFVFSRSTLLVLGAGRGPWIGGAQRGARPSRRGLGLGELEASASRTGTRGSPTTERRRPRAFGGGTA